MVERRAVNSDVPGSRPGGPANKSGGLTDWKEVLHLTMQGVEIFINRSQSKVQKSFWDNYDLVIWKKDSGGYTDLKGMYRKDAWGKAEKISVSREGIWELPKRYVKYFK